MAGISDFVLGSWVTLFVVLIGSIVTLARKVTRIDKDLTEEKTRSKEVDKGHDDQLRKIEGMFNKIMHESETIKKAHLDTKQMFNKYINETRKQNEG